MYCGRHIRTSVDMLLVNTYSSFIVFWRVADAPVRGLRSALRAVIHIIIRKKVRKGLNSISGWRVVGMNRAEHALAVRSARTVV